MILVDHLIRNKIKYNGKEFVKKPIKHTAWIDRIRDAWEVLRGRATAVMFIEDIILIRLGSEREDIK